jgi:cobyrinic acid a,c-diamide synthase
MSAPAVVVAAPASGSGKTVVTLALLGALRRRGLRVGSFKVGPDYIDPAFHARASGQVCRNLDAWAMRLETLAGLGDAIAEDVDLVVGEGVMGLFDGSDAGHGATADVASLFDLPVLLLIDVAGMGASVAALAEGFIRHRDEVEIAGLILNRVASARHGALLRRALGDHVAQPVLGCLPRDPRLELPARHLGLVQAAELPGLDARLQAAAALIAERVDLDQLQRLARPLGLGLHGPRARPLRPLGQRIALASDIAFAFCYPATVEGWRAAGAEILPFSPLADEAPDATADAVYLPGGYPELHAGRLATNGHFLAGLRAAAARGAVVYGECGGYMALGERLTDRVGQDHVMAGLLPISTSFAQPCRQLGYRRLALLAAGPLGPAGATFRGHEFHYAAEHGSAAPPLFASADAAGRPLGQAGARLGNVAGSFLHLIDRSAEAAGQR